MGTFQIHVVIKSNLVKSFEIDAANQVDAEDRAELLAQADIEQGILDGWDMTTDTAILDVGVVEDFGYF